MLTFKGIIITHYILLSLLSTWGKDIEINIIQHEEYVKEINKNLKIYVTTKQNLEKNVKKSKYKILAC